jgi:hypothetical protein
MRFALLGLLFSTALAGCATGNGSFRDDGFHHDSYPYDVRYAEPQARSILGPDWRIDNYIVRPDGSVGEAKTADGYEGNQVIDLDGDGTPDKRKVFYYDLRLTHRRTSATIWLQTFPLAPSYADRDLRVLMHDYVEALSGTDFYATLDGPGHKGPEAKTYAATVRTEKPSTLGPFEAYDATIELANVDQLRLDPNRRHGVVRVILARTDYRRAWTLNSRDVSNIVMRVGYSANPEDFEAGLPDFERFLSLLDLRKANGAVAH